MAFDRSSMRYVDEEETVAPAPSPVSSGFDRSTMRPVDATPTKEKESGFQDFGEGLGVSALELGYGLKDLAGKIGIGGGMSEENKATLKDWQEDAGESGWGTAGQVAGEVGQFMIPGGALTGALKLASKGGRAAKLLSRANALSKANPIKRDIAQGMALGGARLPEEGESRLGEAGFEGAAGLAGGAVGKLLSKAVRGAKVTPEAKKLLDAGVELTPGQAAEGKAIQSLESVMEVTPFLAQTTKRLKAKGADDWVKNAMNQANVKGADDVVEVGTEGLAKLKSNVDKGYKDAWELADDIPEGLGNSLKLDIKEAVKTLSVDDAKALKRLNADINKLGKEASPRSLRALDNVLRKKIKAAKDKVDLREELQGLRATLRDSSPKAQKALAEMDAMYPNYLTVKKAVSKASGADGKFTPKQLESASRAVSGETATATGTGRLQESMLEGAKTIGRKEGGAPLEWFRRLAGGLPSPPGVEMASKAFTGRAPGQKAVASQADALQAMLKKYGLDEEMTSARLAMALRGRE